MFINAEKIRERYLQDKEKEDKENLEKKIRDAESVIKMFECDFEKLVYNAIKLNKEEILLFLNERFKDKSYLTIDFLKNLPRFIKFKDDIKNAGYKIELVNRPNGATIIINWRKDENLPCGPLSI